MINDTLNRLKYSYDKALGSDDNGGRYSQTFREIMVSPVSETNITLSRILETSINIFTASNLRI
jgi:hypothetical protein